MSEYALKDASASNLHFQVAASDPVVVFHNDGRIEFGERYRNNPDAAAQEFIRIVTERWPHLTNPTTGK